jgi:hypothetical protein
MKRDAAKKEHPNASALTMGEIRQAIEASGYPFELQVYREFKAGGFSPGLGLRFDTGGEKFKEIDVHATRAGAALVPGRDVVVQASLRILVAAKKLQGNDVFVGVMGERPGRPQHLAELCHISGSPSNYLPRMSNEAMHLLVGQDGSLAEAIAPLLPPPFCVHWAIANRKQKDGRTWIPWAAGDENFIDDFKSLTRARHEACLRFTRYMSLEARGYCVDLELLAMAVDAKHLFTYNPETRALHRTPLLTLHQMHDTAGGGPRASMIHVVTRAGLSSFVGICRDVHERWIEAVRRNGPALVQEAQVVQLQLQQEARERAIEQEQRGRR